MTFPSTGTQTDLETFFRLSHDNLCIAGYDGYFRRVNPAFVKLMGYSEEELFAVPISSFVHPQDREITAETRALILKEKPLLNFENRYITKAGEVVWLTWTSIPDHPNELIYAVSKNITGEVLGQRFHKPNFLLAPAAFPAVVNTYHPEQSVLKKDWDNQTGPGAVGF